MKKTIALFLLLVFLFSLSSCSSLFGSKGDHDKKTIRVGVLSGPTGIGMAKLMADVKSDNTIPYEFELYASPDIAITDFLAGNIDFVCLPSNTASTIYNKQSEDVRVVAVNCLCSLFVVSKTNKNITSFYDLDGKTIAISVPSSTTKPIIDYLATSLGITVDIEMYNTHDALVTELQKADNNIDIAVLPEPKVSALLMQNKNYEVSVSIGDVWQNATGVNLPMGCMLTNQTFLLENTELSGQFLLDYQASVAYMADRDQENSASQMIVDAGILPKLPLAVSALQNLDGVIVCHQNEEMKNELLCFYSLLNSTAPSAIGNSIPKDEFFYEK